MKLVAVERLTVDESNSGMAPPNKKWGLNIKSGGGCKQNNLLIKAREIIGWQKSGGGG